MFALASSLALAKNGRDFAGSYHIQRAAPAGPAVQVVLAVRVFNYADHDLKAATVLLESSFAPFKPLGAFPNVSIPRSGSTLLKGEFTIPYQEYKRWGGSAAPRLVMDFATAEGKRRRVPIELIASNGGGEE